MTDSFHEEVAVELRLDTTLSAGALNRALRGLGFKLDYDVYSMSRPDEGAHPVWQSECLVEVELLRGGEPVDAQDGCDTLRLVYPLATIDSSMTDPFLGAVDAVKAAFGGSLLLAGELVTTSDVSAYMTACITKLMEEWGEEPGSESLRLMIEANYG